ncbi:MAG: hypothetical protein RLZ98_1257 [Pseudomonadota bacterium]|jgi:hypothetical protein
MSYELMYSPAEIARDVPRLKQAVEKIFAVGIRPHLAPAELSGLGDVRIEFPPPAPDSTFLNFYAYRSGGRATVVMPLLSLKQLEDLATAYAWLQVNGKSLSTIDLYCAMLRHKPLAGFAGGRYPPILPALGVPANANDDPNVDRLSLPLRNEAYAFILVHELAHVLFRHQPYSRISRARARADELQSDRFALEVLTRTNTPPMGAFLFFQAQVYAMPHRGQYASEAEWLRYLEKYATHPLSTERIELMAATMRGPLIAKRPKEAATWRFIATGVLKLKDILEDPDIQRCIQKTAREVPLSRLAPTTTTVGLGMCAT